VHHGEYARRTLAAPHDGLAAGHAQHARVQGELPHGLRGDPHAKPQPGEAALDLADFVDAVARFHDCIVASGREAALTGIKSGAGRPIF
jgi:hypothetical protein